MKNLAEATNNLIEAISSNQSSDKEVNKALHQCFEYLPDSNKEEIDTFMKRVFALSSLPNIDRASYATSICGHLAEHGFPADAIVDDLIDFYDNLLDKSKPFFDLFYSKVEELEDSDEDDEDYDKDSEIDALYLDLLNDEDFVSEELRNTVISLDKFYSCAIAVFSADKENLYKGKDRLQKKVAYIGNYSEGCYWLDKLFTVFFDEPVIVIDIDKKIGFSGKINGIVENFQLQHLLMSLPFLNDGESAISEETLAVINGTGEQRSDKIIECKWNMYNREVIESPEWNDFISGKSDLPTDLSDTWIWSEGAPSHISVHNGYRVILLGKASYKRTSHAQRTFNSLKAGIEIENELSSEEINEWLKI